MTSTTSTAWLLYQDGRVTDVYPDRETALGDLGARTLDGEPFVTPRLLEAPWHGSATIGDVGGGNLISEVITSWRSMTGTGRTKVAQRAAGLAQALDALCFPMVVTRAAAADDDGGHWAPAGAEN
jgi:hypothetical protein